MSSSPSFSFIFPNFYAFFGKKKRFEKNLSFSNIYLFKYAYTYEGKIVKLLLQLRRSIRIQLKIIIFQTY